MTADGVTVRSTVRERHERTCPPNRKLGRSEILVADFGKFEGHAGDTYEGGWLDGMRHGKGRATWPDGRVFEGDWVEDLQQGRGKSWAPDFNEDGEPGNTTYEGEWKESQRHGNGIEKHADGRTYHGCVMPD